jgi:hypothetical protein
MLFLCPTWGGGNDDLNGFGIVGIGNGMIQEANTANDFVCGTDLVGRKVGRISEDHGGLGHLSSGFGADGLAILIHNLSMS